MTAGTAGLSLAPQAHGIDGPSSDLVFPSLPGYGFSERPTRPDIPSREVAVVWHELMSGLGYERYGAGGSDFGSSVTTFMALGAPDAMVGIHLSNLDVEPYHGSGVTAALGCRASVRGCLVELEAGRGRLQRGTVQQATDPGLCLNDSPAGFATWIVEKWRLWSDSEGMPERRVPRDTLLTILTIHWATGTINSSMRDYYDNRWHAEKIGPPDRVIVPTGIANLNRQLVNEGEPPREWAE